MRWNTAREEVAHQNVSRKAFAIVLGVIIALGFCLLANAPTKAHADSGVYVAGEPSGEGNVAKIGDREFATLKQAIDASQNGDTIEMIADSPDEAGFNFGGRSITLDLNGKTVTEKKDPTVSGGTLTIKDNSSGKNGTLVCHFVSYDSNGVLNLDEANLILESGTLDTSFGIYVMGRAASATIDGGSVISRENGSAIALQGGMLTINGGFIECEYGTAISIEENASAPVVITNGEIRGSQGVESRAGSPVEVDGGLIEGKSKGIFAGDNFIIKGGTITGTDNDGFGVYVTLGGVVEISGGQIKGGAGRSVGFYEDLSGHPEGSITISGGIFSDKAGEGSLAEGYGFFDNTDPQTMSDYPFVAGKPKFIDIPKGLTLTWTGHDQCGVDEGTGYTLTGQIAKDVGNYTAKATLKSGYRWKDGTADVKDIPWKIVPASIDIPKGLTLTWTGQGQCGVAKGTGYTLTGQIGTDAGNYTAKATLVSGYRWNDGTTDVKDIPWKIVPASITGAKVTLAKTSYTCNDTAKAPKVKKVALNGKTLNASTDYTVSYKNNVKPGTATAIVTGKGNYGGTAKATFTIKLAKTKVRTAAYPSKKKIIVSWNAVKGAKSYQLKWRLKGGKWKTVSLKATKKALKKLQVGKCYNFRVRAVAGKVKGPWSAVVPKILK